MSKQYQFRFTAVAPTEGTAELLDALLRELRTAELRFDERNLVLHMFAEENHLEMCIGFMRTFKAFHALPVAAVPVIVVSIENNNGCTIGNIKPGDVRWEYGGLTMPLQATGLYGFTFATK